MKKKPAGLIPEPLRGSEPDSFAYYTITVRFPRIIKQVLQENDLPTEEQKSLEELSAEIPEKPLRPLLDQNSPDARKWSEYLLPYIGQNWLQTPWFICETYFFRRIIEAIRYYKKSPEERLDPYRRQKESSLDNTLAGLRTPFEQMPLKSDTTLKNALSEALFMGVWGNQTDLSMWPAGSNQGPDQVDGQNTSHLLVNEANLIIDHLMNEGSTRVDLILDNAAAELSHDLLLADLLISSPLESRVHLHVKPHPTYVSDATAHDVHVTVEALTKTKQRGLREAGQRLSESILNGCLQINEDYYWTSPLSGWQMPDKLYNNLAKAHLIISKGDANYRRFLGDRHWPFTTAFAEITHYRPAPLAALRVLKSDTVCGLKPEQPTLMRQKDLDWMIDGRWGVIQFAY